MMSLGEIAFLVLLVAFAFAVGYGAGKVKRFKRTPEQIGNAVHSEFKNPETWVSVGWNERERALLSSLIEHVAYWGAKEGQK